MPNTVPADQRKVLHIWANCLSRCIENKSTDAPMSSRQVSILFEAMYNAWAIYQNPNKVKPSLASEDVYILQNLVGSQLPQVHPLETKITAMSYAAFTVLSNLYPSQVAGVITTALYDSADNLENMVSVPIYITRAQTYGVTIGNLVIADRQDDNSNQYGVGSTEGTYVDTTGYTPTAFFDLITDSNNITNWATLDQTKWMPLYGPNSQGDPTYQVPLAPHWGRVKTFAIAHGGIYRPNLTRLTPSQDEVDELLNLMSTINDNYDRKAIVDIFAKNPGSNQPPGQWMDLAITISDLDSNTLDQDVKLFFGVGQALHDAGVASWDVKYYYDSVRPITYIRNFYRGQNILGWEGWNSPATGSPTYVAAENWVTYQRPHRQSPNFPEIVSGHSTFSAASATIIAGLRNSDYADTSLTLAAGAIGFETNMPPADVTINFSRISEIADLAGMSRRYSGIHFEQGDLTGRTLGRQVALTVYDKIMRLFGSY